MGIKKMKPYCVECVNGDEKCPNCRETDTKFSVNWTFGIRGPNGWQANRRLPEDKQTPQNRAEMAQAVASRLEVMSAYWNAPTFAEKILAKVAAKNLVKETLLKETIKTL